MISIKINDINNFMNRLLIENIFDDFLVIQADINTFASFSIDGKINNSFFNSEELSDMHEKYASWSKIKPTCFNIIKGDHVPTKMKIILGYPHSKLEKMLVTAGVPFSVSDIGGLYINILYENNTVSLITGTTLNTFSIDKSLEKYWDYTIRNFISKNFDCEIFD